MVMNEATKQSQKKYYENNRQQILNQKKEYYQKNKETIKNKSIKYKREHHNETLYCKCGGYYQDINKRYRLLTKMHRNFEYCIGCC